MYAAGSGHTEVTKILLAQPAICVNIRNNDRLTTFMLAMQVVMELVIAIATFCVARWGGMPQVGPTVEEVAVGRNS